MKKFLLIAALIILLPFLGVFLYVLIVPADTSVLKDAVGLYKTQVIGFQPFWTVSAGKTSYANDVTTLTYFGLAVNPDGTIRKEDNPGETEPGWAMLNSPVYEASLSAARKKGTKLSLLVQNMVEEDILTLIASPSVSAKNLVSDVAPIMREHGFTDLNLDIESFTKATEATRSAYTAFVREVKDEMEKEDLGTLTVELTPKSPVEPHFIDVSEIGEIADYVVLMAYDYHYVFSDVAGPVAPVSGGGKIYEYDVETALRQTLRFVPPSKVILGIPLYGYEWETLVETPGAPVIPRSWATATHKRIEETLKDCVDCRQSYDLVSREPSLIFPGETEGHFQQIFYENEQSLSEKMELAKRYKLGGTAFWALGYEGSTLLDPVRKYRNSIIWEHGSLLTDPQFTIEAPDEAMKGIITGVEGMVERWKRTDDGYKEMETTEPILQGEAVRVGEGGQLDISFGTVASISAQAYAELEFPELVSPNMLLWQTSGTVRYRVLSTIPFSVRVLHSLVTLTKGRMEIAVDDPTAEVRVLEGNVLIGNIDVDNVTTTYPLEASQSAWIHDVRRTVQIY